MSKSKGHALDAGLLVVLDVLVRIDGVVRNCPEDIGCEEREGCREVLLAEWIHFEGTESDEDGPSEREPEDDLWVVGDSLHEGVDEEENRGDSSMNLAGVREREQNPIERNELHKGKGETLRG